MINMNRVRACYRDSPWGIDGILTSWLKPRESDLRWKPARCPLCDDPDRFRVRLDDGAWRCDGCRSHGDIFELFGRMWSKGQPTRLPFPEVLARLLESLEQMYVLNGIEGGLPEDVSSELQRYRSRPPAVGTRPNKEPRRRPAKQVTPKKPVDVREAILDELRNGPRSTRQLWRTIRRRRGVVSDALRFLEMRRLIRRAPYPDRRGVMQKHGAWIPSDPWLER